MNMKERILYLIKTYEKQTYLDDYSTAQHTFPAYGTSAQVI